MPRPIPREAQETVRGCESSRRGRDFESIFPRIGGVYPAREAQARMPLAQTHQTNVVMEKREKRRGEKVPRIETSGAGQQDAGQQDAGRMRAGLATSRRLDLAIGRRPRPRIR